MAKTPLPGRGGSLSNLSAEKQLIIIGLDTDDGPEMPLYDERINNPLSDATKASIRQHGVKDPVDVVCIKGKHIKGKKWEWPTDDDGNILLLDGKWEDGDPIVVADGRQRVRHVRAVNEELGAAGEDEADFVKVPCQKVKAKVSEDLMIVGNNHRENDDLPTRVAKLQRWLIRNPDDIEGAAMRFNCTTATIRNYLKYDNLAPKVQKAVLNNEVSFHAALEWAGMDPKEQTTALQEAKAAAPEGKKVTKRAAQKTRADTTGDDKARPPLKKRLMQKMIIAHGGDNHGVSEDIITGMRLAMGDIDPKSVKGVTKLVKAAEEL